MFLTLNIGLPQSTFQFDETIAQQIIENFTQKFNIKVKNELNQEPLVFLSTKEPQNIQNWYKKKLKGLNFIIQYSKQQNGILKFYYQIIEDKRVKYQLNIITITLLVTYALITSNMMRYNILYIHSVLTSQGDVFFGPSYSGKTTLAHRLYLNNRYNKAIVSDGIVLNFENQNLLYPLPEIWIKGKITLFDDLFKENKGYKLRNLYHLFIGKNEDFKKEKKERWKKVFLDSIRILFNIPFAYARKTSYQNRKEKWIDCGEGMRDKIQKRCQQLSDKFLQTINLDYLSFSINSKDYKCKVKNIQDECI